MITAVLTALSGNRNTEGVEELRRIFSGDFGGHFMMTATGITYGAGASEIVTHDSGTPEQRTLEARLVRPDGPVDVTQALLGNGDAIQVRDVYKWVTRREPYLWLVNVPPKQVTERALVLGGNVVVFYGDFSIDAVDYVSSSWPARGVRIAPPQNSTGSKG